LDPNYRVTRYCTVTERLSVLLKVALTPSTAASVISVPDAAHPGDAAFIFISIRLIGDISTVL
jgi:hypothetical protein